MNIRIRSEAPSDASAIEAVTVAAFLNASHASHTEHLIVDALRRSRQLTISLVAEEHGQVIGHVAISPVSIIGGVDKWYGLGPISVVPERQGRGVGTQLMEHALAELRARGAAGCVVLGDPSYYCRFGFQAEPSLVLPGVPPAYFQVVSFGGPMPTGTVSYHDSFAAQG